MNESIKSQYAVLLNTLDWMQGNMAYAIRRDTLKQAEDTIISLERTNQTLAVELATVKAELDSVRDCRDHQATMLDDYVQQVIHWKAEAVWAANEFMKERECFFQVSYMGQWEMEIAKDPDYQRAQAILKGVGDDG